MPSASTLTSTEPETAARLRQTIAKLYRRLRARDAAGLSPSRVSALLNVDRNGPLRISALAEAEGLNPTMLSRLVGELVEAGLIERVADPEDRRAAHVVATSEGHTLAERLRHERTTAVTEALHRLTPAEARHIAAALPALEALADQLLGDRP